jgi:hypothetical protein
MGLAMRALPLTALAALAVLALADTAHALRLLSPADEPTGDPDLVGGCAVTLSAQTGELGMLLVLLALGGVALANRRRRRRD